jgi:hypothetical protein
MAQITSPGTLHFEDGRITLEGWHFKNVGCCIINGQLSLEALDAVLDHIREVAVRNAISSGEIS